ncbi:pyridoxamine 5'-phosphate oxidase family protein [Kouleothrix sp.]|uniref:pyridoxamine 5'-phosphate oxidase family protein n=1 Tax=Kouleothrix sp. TaxID=2779161 RepID=UPI00391AAF8A
MQVESFAALAEPFLERVSAAVWCNMATVDARGRPRSRVVHPVWDGAEGWLGTRRDSFKGRHLALHPAVSLAYVSDPARPVYVDAYAAWADDLATRQRVWELFLRTAPPLGYDPAPIFKSLEGFGLLKLTPWRIEVATPPQATLVWRPGELPE